MKIILCDIHKTLLDEEKNLNNSIVFALRSFSISPTTLICMVTASTLSLIEITDLKKRINERGINAQIFSNRLGLNADDVDIKEDLLKQVKETYPNADVFLALDNNKNICKLYRKSGIDTLRFKKH